MTRLLLVDDEVSILSGTSDLLRCYGYDVVEASSGQAALDILNGPENEFALVICDIKMPDISGLELLERLQQQGNLEESPPMLFFSAYINTRDLKLIEEAAIPTNFIEKPFDMPEFLLTIKTMLEKSYL